MSRLSTLVILEMVIVATLLAVTCSHAIDAPAKTGAGQRLKTIVVDNYHPYTFVNEKGEPDGFSIEIARAVAKAMDFELEIRADKWDVAMKELEAGTIDLLPMMAHSPERDKTFDFSVPHTIAYDTIFIKKGSTGLRTLKDLSGKTVFVMKRDIAHSYLLSSGLSKTMDINLVDSLPEALKQLSAGKGDAAVMPKLVGIVTAKKLKLSDIETSSQLIDAYNRPFSFAVRDNNLALLERINQGLNIIKNSGEYDAIYKKWFGALEGSRVNLKMLLRYGTAAVLIFLGIIAWNVNLKRQVKAKTDHLVAEIVQRQQAEELLRKSSAALTISENRYRGLFESAKDGILILEAETGMVLDVNPFMIELLGFSHEQFLGKKIWELGFFKDIIASKDNFGELQLKEYIRFENLALETSEGRRIPVEFISNVSLVNEQKVIQCSIRDITERKRAEETLRQRAEMLRASNDELELFNRAAVGRELRMIELKKEIDELCRRLGESPRYGTGRHETDHIPGAAPAPGNTGEGGA